MAFCHGAGNYIFTLFDNFAGSVPLLVIALAECLSIAYVYGLKRFAVALMFSLKTSVFFLSKSLFSLSRAPTHKLLSKHLTVFLMIAGFLTTLSA